MDAMVQENDVDLLRKRKFNEVVKESKFKTMRDVVELHPDKFTVDIIDKIPLTKSTRAKDEFLESIDIHGSIQKYSHSVTNPPSPAMEALLLSAEGIKNEIGRIFIA